MSTASTNVTSAASVDQAAALLRISTAFLFLMHAGLKVFVFTPAGTAGYFASIGLPGFLAYIVILVEILGAVALIVGFQTRITAIILGLDLLGAAWFGHVANGFFFTNANGGWEYPVFWAVVMFALALLGGGAYSIDKR